MSTTAVDSGGLFAGLSRVAELESLGDRVRAIATELLAFGWRRVDVRVFEEWREIAQFGGGQSSVEWSVQPEPDGRKTLFSALSAFEDDGVTIANLDRFRHFAPAFTVRGAESHTCLVFVQLIVVTRVVGLVILDAGDNGAPGRAAIDLLRSYCDIAALLFDTERTTARVRRDAERGEVLARVGAVTRRSLDRRTMLDHVVGEVREAFKAGRCVFYERDRENPREVRVAALDDAKSIEAPLPGVHTLIPGGFLTRAFDTGEIIAIEKLGESEAFERIKRYGLRAFLLSPIVSGDGSIDAAMSVHFAHERTFDQVDLVLLRSVAMHLGLALDNAHAYEELRRAAHERSVLSEAARMILAFTRPEPLAAAMTRLALGLAGADRSELFVPRDGGLRRIGCATDYGDSGDFEMAPFDDPLLGSVYRTGETRIEDGHVVILALPSTDHVAGVLVCHRKGDALPFDSDDVRLLESFCAQLGLGLRNCELYEAESAANYALAESNEFKDDLLAMFTHDFKGPLTVISGFAELMLEAGPGERRGDIEMILNQAKRLARLAEDALGLARAQATGFALNREDHDLVVFVRETVAGSTRETSRIDLELPGAPVKASIDAVRLRDALDNIVGNALKYSSERIGVRIESALGSAHIIVVDHGMGIPLGERDRIFARFGRGSNARRRGVAGTGVGLYTARKIVEAHGGTLDVHSAENQGSAFTITLPTLVGFDFPARAISG